MMAVTGKASLSFYAVALIAQGATTATSLTAPTITPPYHDTDYNASRSSAHKQATTYRPAGEMTNDCPAGHESVLSEQECIDAAPRMCANGFGFSGPWSHDPVGCFVHPTTSFSSCTVYFNTLASSSPSTAGTFKICKQAQAPTPSPTPSPTSAPTSSPTVGNNEASGTGDPHLKNMRGESFDLLRPGKFLLIDIPRGRPVEDALLVVEADAHRLGGNCADLYFVALNITGAWADMAQTGGLRFDAYATPDEKPKWAKYGPVDLKIAHGRTVQGIRYLNIYARHLGRAGFAVGGLLGEDDHSEAVVPTDGCLKTLALTRKGAGKGLPRAGSVAEAM